MQPLKIVVCGDFRAAHPEKIQMSQEVKDIFDGSEFSVCNFEAPIHTDNTKPLKKSGPSLDQSAKSPEKVKELGFNVILMANNHIMDYGEAGMCATLKSFEDVVTVGAGISNEAFRVQFVEKAGHRVGLLSLVQHEFGVIEGLGEAGMGAAWINSSDVMGIITKAKEECDILLVFPHAGVEHTDAPLPEWRRLYKNFINWGADAVIASHPHCPQGWETYQGKPIYYSLGDFYFDELTYDDLWYKSIVVELNIGDSLETKEYYVCFDDETGLIEIDRSERISQYISRVNGLLQNDAEYMNYINKLCAQLWLGFKYGILRGVCGVSLKMRLKYIIRLLGCMLLGNADEMYLLNALQCESHRWVAERYLSNNN